MEYYIKNIKDVKKNKSAIEKKLNVSIKIMGNKVSFEGDPLDEYEASLVFDALSFGFSERIATMLKDEENTIKIIHIKDHTRRNLRDVQARLIGTKGKTKRVMSNISNCNIIIKEGKVGIIGDIKDVENVSTALISLIKGSKHANMYSYLERMNRIKKEQGDIIDKIIEIFRTTLLA